MRIGIDLDDTILNTKEEYRKYQHDFLVKEKITEKELWNKKKYRVKYIKDSIERILDSVTVKENAIEVMMKLKKTGNEIYIITARNKEYNENIYELTKKNIEKNNIPYDNLILTDRKKVKECIDNEIELMIDNSIDVFNQLNGKINVLLFDELNVHKNISNKINNWNDILDFVSK